MFENGTGKNGRGRLVRRHRLSTRLWHWANLAILIVLLMSGLMIFNFHPRLYWGEFGANPDPAWFEITAEDERGFLTIADTTVATTGVLGAWQDSAGNLRTGAFPSWVTLPSHPDLATARRWHLTFAWLFGGGLVVYLVWSLANGHLRRDLLQGRAVSARSGRGVTCRYSPAQRLVYISILIVVLPTVILTGLTMSPMLVASWPWLLDLFGGRQSARSLHFILAAALVVFVFIHVATLLLDQPLNRLRSMLTGRFRDREENER